MRGVLRLAAEFSVYDIAGSPTRHLGGCTFSRVCLSVIVLSPSSAHKSCQIPQRLNTSGVITGGVNQCSATDKAKVLPSLCRPTVHKSPCDTSCLVPICYRTTSRIHYRTSKNLVYSPQVNGPSFDTRNLSLYSQSRTPLVISQYCILNAKVAHTHRSLA